MVFGDHEELHLGGMLDTDLSRSVYYPHLFRDSFELRANCGLLRLVSKHLRDKSKQIATNSMDLDRRSVEVQARAKRALHRLQRAWAVAEDLG
jgi:hypothetical protein